MNKHNANSLRRKTYEHRLVEKYKGAIVPFNPVEHHPLVDSFKDGSFGHSTSAFALYSHGHKKNAHSAFAPFGLIYHDGGVMFSMGYFRRELDGKDYLVLTAPKIKEGDAQEAVRKVVNFVNEILAQTDISGVYVRFLDLHHYLHFLNAGFLPAKEHPWHPEAPEEDEHLNYSKIDLNAFFERGTIKSRYPRLQVNRFRNYLQRSKASLALHETSKDANVIAQETELARGIVSVHFSFLEKMGKAISSSFEDYLNLTDHLIWNLPPVFTHIGWLYDPEAGLNIPVSFSLGEQLSSTTAALYCLVALRPQLIGEETRGKNALIKYSHHLLFRDLYGRGIETVHIGGSEHPDLNWAKRKWGAELNPTYWCVKISGPRGI